MQTLTAYGAFIVEDAGQPVYEYDDELIILLGEIYHASDSNITTGLLNATFTWIGEPQAITVNGDALGSCNSTTSKCTSTCRHHVLDVDSDKTYRVRTIGTSSLTFPYYAIEGHGALTVIAADGHYLSPVNSSYVQVDSGQRFDYLLRSKSAQELVDIGKTTFWGRIETRWRPAKDQGAFILSYRDRSGLANLASSATPVDLNQTVHLPTEADPWINSQIRPQLDVATEDARFPPDSSVTRNITLNTSRLTWNGTRRGWLVNGAIVCLFLPLAGEFTVTEAVE